MDENNIILETDLNGQPVSFTIIPMESKFGIAYKGQVIAEVAYNEEWEQVSGDTMPGEVLQSIFQKIDAHYH
ncbi:hypothetical protein [Mucilaginibacter agri]|uniref:Uncharacterized protein n=1 Tax=Mucilaginibacter agri TaxID=2695265 RepID=A0A965ZD87_9SPHI|nr:hypothetical protein [Mucilaginibacter agri]NCD67992.1 hypothetical protein [Mucilaginibacter agri]